MKDSNWYLKTIIKAELIDYGPVKGTIVFRPYAYFVWERIQNLMDQELKNLGIKNTYFPLFIPESFLKKEKEHLEGFSPEVAVVTFAGGEELSEKLIVRPTSETIMYYFFAKWIKSYRDLPFLINQWCNVVRWEKRPLPFIRNTEFLWQEGHTAHLAHKEARDFALKALKMYEKFYQEVLGLFGYSGRKSKQEKFAGALETYTYEILLPDGKALQGCTSHDLGQNFAKPFEVIFQDKKGKNRYVWQTSFGFTTRSMGAILWVHGDEKGLILPPKISPYQIVIIPIYKKENKKINQFAIKIKEELKGYRVYFDDSDHTPGYKFNEWELKGVPLRLEIGEKEMKQNKLTVFRRDTYEKFSLTLDDFKSNLENILNEIQKNLFERSKKYTLENTREAKDYQEFKKIINSKKGFVKAYFCESKECEEKIKEETKASSRCLPLDSKVSRGKCLYCQKPTNFQWLFAQSY